MNNPLLQKSTLPLFHLIKTQHLVPAVNKAIDEHREKLEKILNNKKTYTWRNLFLPLEEIDERLSCVWSVVSHLNHTVNSTGLRKAYNICLPKITQYYLELGQNNKLYAAVFGVAQSKEYKKFDVAQKKVIQNMLRDFHLSGIDLGEKDRQNFIKLQEKLSKLQTRFSENVLDATDAWSKLITDQKKLKGLPEHILAAAQSNALQKKQKGWLLTLHAPFYQAVLTYADNRVLRKETYLAYVTRASSLGKHKKRLDNTKLIPEILLTRHKIAKLLQFKNYAELSLATKMVADPNKVLNFLYDLVKCSRKKARAEFLALEKFAAKNCQIKKLAPWDIAYYSEKMRKQKHDVSEEVLRQYFPLEQILAGMWQLFKRLYDLKIKELKNVPVWHKDVRVWEICDSKNKIIGKFYLDLYARSNKQGGAWMDSCCTRRQLANGKIQNPIAYVVCNFSPPVIGQSVLLNFGEVDTLFHEFGHALQHLLTQVIYASVSGIHGVPWDAVEIASQFMEKWCLEKEVLETITKHHKTKEILPEQLLEKMLNAKNMQSGLQMIRQLEFGLFDFLCHVNFTPNDKNYVQKIIDEIHQKVSVLPVSKYNCFPNSFLHIFSGAYAAGYYSYKWAEVTASDAFAKFKEDGLFNKKTARSFLQNMLASGGAVDPLLAFKKFRGREPSIDALLKETGIKK